jgi:Zn-finger nucleic acid-binding protein
MDLEDAGDVRVDVCLSCHGVWLDHGELDRLAGMEDAYFLGFNDEKAQELLRARSVRRQERQKALSRLFRGLSRR